MSIKSILFSTEEVRAILDGKKTATRKKIKHGVVETWFKSPYVPRMLNDNLQNVMLWIDPPCKTGDIIYVRETWMDPCEGCAGGVEFPCNGCLYGKGYRYKADYRKNEKSERWHPSVHMPKEAARIWLKVTDVRVERLKKITNEGAMREGASGEPIYSEAVRVGEEAIWNFMIMWESRIPKYERDRYGWDANPWVWVIEFERCAKPEGE
jgi:hypothetical protein